MTKQYFTILTLALVLVLAAAPAGATPLLQDSERQQIVKSEGWADLYFAGLTASALDNSSTSGMPKTLADLEKSSYLLWVPNPASLKITDVSKSLTAGRLYSNNDLTGFENDLLIRKHRGDFALKPGEVLIAYSDGFVLFAAGIQDSGKPAMYGPKKIEVRRSPNTVQSFLYRQVREAVQMYEVKKQQGPGHARRSRRGRRNREQECPRKALPRFLVLEGH